MEPQLSEELRQALKDSNGFLRGESYILMSMPLFKEMVGSLSEEELAASLKAIDRGFADVDAGRTRPLREVFADLGGSAIHD